MASRLTELMARVRAMISVFRELFSPTSKERSAPGELTWHHPQLRHGIYIRNDGVVDVHSRGSVLGVGPLGVSIESPACYIGAPSLLIRAERFALRVPEDGYILSGRRLNPELVRGESVLSWRLDANVLVESDSLRTTGLLDRLPSATPWRVGEKSVVAVPIRELFRAIEFTQPVAGDGWIDELIQTLTRSVVQDAHGT